MADQQVWIENSKLVSEKVRSIPRAIKLALADGLDHSTRSFYSRLYKTRLSGPPGLRSTRGGIFHRFRRVTEANGKKIFLRQSASQSQTIKAIANSAKDPLDMKIELYSSSKVANIHEKGGTIHSSGMPIPLNEKARAMARGNQSLNNLAVLPINGKIFLGINRKFGDPELLFILKRSVRIKPRLGFYRTWDNLASRRDQIMNDALDDAMRKINA